MLGSLAHPGCPPPIPFPPSSLEAGRDRRHPGPHPDLGRGGSSQWGPQPQTLDPAVSTRRPRRKRVYHLGDLDCSRLKFNPRCVLRLAMLFKHIKGHKKIPMARAVPSQARREPAFNSDGFPEAEFRARGGKGAIRKKENGLFSQRNTRLPKAAGETESRAPGTDSALQFRLTGKTSSGKMSELQL